MFYVWVVEPFTVDVDNMHLIQMLLITRKATQMNLTLMAVTGCRDVISMEQMQMQLHRVHERAREQGGDRDRGHSNTCSTDTLHGVKYRVELESATNWRVRALLRLNLRS